MKEVAAFKALLDRNQFVQYRQIFLGLPDIQVEHKYILKTLGNYYDEFPEADRISVDELQTYFEAVNPSIKNAEMIKRVFEDLRSADLTNVELLNKVLHLYIRKYYCGAIMQAAVDGSDGQSDTAIEDIQDMIEKYKEVAITLSGTEVEDTEVCTVPMREILEDVITGGYEWPITAVQDIFGNLKRSTLGHIFARPNVGKSSFAINIAWTVVRQLMQQNEDGVVLYMNNEEAIKLMRLRMLCCITQAPATRLIKESVMARAEQLWKQQNWDRYIKFIGGVSHIATVERHLSRYRPVVAIIDQGPKVSIYNRDVTEVQRLQILYNQYREMAKRYDTALITVGQASSEAENKQYLSLNYLDSSKVGIPGELDWAIAIGARDYDAPQLRYINVAKNKGRMGRSRCNFEDDICRYYDLKDGSQRQKEKANGKTKA